MTALPARVALRLGPTLTVLDPTGREQLISVVAAVFTLRLALHKAGYGSDFVLFPRS